MKEQKLQSLKPSSDTLTTALKSPASESAHDAPPRGSALLIETALVYARRAETSARDGDTALVLDRLTVVIEQLEQVREKIDRQRALGSS